jgi:hypothetical protein
MAPSLALLLLDSSRAAFEPPGLAIAGRCNPPQSAADTFRDPGLLAASKWLRPLSAGSVGELPEAAPGRIVEAGFGEDQPSAHLGWSLSRSQQCSNAKSCFFADFCLYRSRARRSVSAIEVPDLLSRKTWE